MTFEEWWEQLEVFRMPEDERHAVDFARIAWESATKAEREACAKLCEETGAYTDEIEMAQMCAANIRSR